MQTTKEYKDNAEANGLKDELTAAILASDYMIPIVDLHTFNEVNEPFVWLKTIDKTDTTRFLMLSKSFMDQIARGMMTAKAKLEMHIAEENISAKEE